MEYTLVSESGRNLKEGKLSIGTPIAQALLGHKKGEEGRRYRSVGRAAFRDTEYFDLTGWVS